jgi:Carboxypeptidase regulatory-like domain
MKRILASFMLLLLLSLPSTAGTITGTIRAEGKPEVQDDLKSGKYESRKYKFLERIQYSELKDFLVYIDQPISGFTLPPPKTVQVIIQKDGTFQPHVLPILVGTTIEWPNHDEIYHNVFSMSDPKQFDLGLYKNDQLKRVLFDKPGKIDVFCSIHTKMHCILFVLENPYYATTDTKGHYNIKNIPAGTYTLRAWHERLPSQTKEITVPQTGEVRADFVLGVTGLPKY